MDLDHLAKLLRAYRKEAKLTQKQAGQAVGQTAQSISEYERGNSPPPLRVLAALLELYGRRLELRAPKAGDGEPGPVRVDLLPLVESADALEPRKQELLLRIARLMPELAEDQLAVLQAEVGIWERRR